MKAIPIFVGAWELACCQPDITTRDYWTARPILFKYDESDPLMGPRRKDGSPVAVIKARIKPHPLSSKGAPAAVVNGLVVAAHEDIGQAADGRWILVNDHHWLGTDDEIERGAISPAEPDQVDPDYPLQVRGVVSQLFAMKYEYAHRPGWNALFPVSETVVRIESTAPAASTRFSRCYYDTFLVLLVDCHQDTPAPLS